MNERMWLTQYDRYLLSSQPNVTMLILLSIVLRTMPTKEAIANYKTMMFMRKQ